ncbi:sigma-70 family RNA polymerase sigma factor, partial [Streptomyces katsurahamanus]
MDAITMDTIKAAQTNDLSAIAEVVKAMESRIANIAYKAGSSAEQRDEYAQIGRIEVWEALNRFSGETVDSFFAFMHQTVANRLKDARQVERMQGATGADIDAMKVFNTCMKEANGDIDVAERLCQTLPPKGRRLSAERAHAARLAWDLPVSLDMPVDNDGFSLTDTLVSDYGVPDDLVEVRDITADKRRRRIETVRAVIDSMGAKQAHILKATYG